MAKFFTKSDFHNLRTLSPPSFIYKLQVISSTFQRSCQNFIQNNGSNNSRTGFFSATVSSHLCWLSQHPTPQSQIDFFHKVLNRKERIPVNSKQWLLSKSSTADSVDFEINHRSSRQKKLNSFLKKKSRSHWMAPKHRNFHGSFVLSLGMIPSPLRNIDKQW